MERGMREGRRRGSIERVTATRKKKGESGRKREEREGWRRGMG